MQVIPMSSGPSHRTHRHHPSGQAVESSERQYTQCYAQLQQTEARNLVLLEVVHLLHGMV